MDKFNFKISKKSKKSQARAGIINTPHGLIHTPTFFPVGTKATVKGITPRQLDEMNIEAVLCNTYHLFLRPGDKIIKKLGGLHKFMNWSKPIITDSGGFQVFSLGFGMKHGVSKIVGSNKKNTRNKNTEQFAKITEEGVHFRSFIDGAKHFISPEDSMKIQENLGADIIFAFDECTSPLSSYKYTKEAMDRTHRWAIRSLKAHKKKNQMLFGIVQGGEFKDLRLASSKFIGGMDFDGFGIGGSFGKFEKKIKNVLDWSLEYLPETKPKHLLGIGSVKDVIDAIKKGIDTFDCVSPTRLGRNGTAITAKGNLNLKAGRFLLDKKPIETGCQCYACVNFNRAYIRHLFQSEEMLAGILTTLHNVYFMDKLMKDIRKDILKGKF
ncbi:tRNA guanosine(34) transglycosylase Tgt [Patescibacteria group bacterium]|nr:tRNA guanosine(34) transglycosylase Tgt [Patescibacteria group bacterium]